MTTTRDDDRDAVAGEVVDDNWGTAPGYDDDGYREDPNAAKTVDGQLNAMGKELRQLTRASLFVTLAAGALLFLTDLWNQQGYGTTTGFVVGATLATVNLWILAGGYFAVVDKRGTLPRLMLAFIGSMIVMFGAALFVIFAKREWTLGFALGLALPALSGILHGVMNKRDGASSAS